jgi:hypothetical protein
MPFNTIDALENKFKEFEDLLEKLSSDNLKNACFVFKHIILTTLALLLMIWMLLLNMLLILN